jgi:predicted ATPase
MGIFDIFKGKKTKSKDLNLTNLFFKSNEACYEYSKKYFSAAILENKALVLGIVYLIGNDKKSAYVKCALDINNKQTEILVVTFFDDFEHPINIGDFVYVGIVDIGKVFNFNELENAINQGKLEGIKNLKDATIGTIVQKLTTELDIKSGQFIPFK